MLPEQESPFVVPIVTGGKRLAVPQDVANQVYTPVSNLSTGLAFA